MIRDIGGITAQLSSKTNSILHIKRIALYVHVLPYYTLRTIKFSFGRKWNQILYSHFLLAIFLHFFVKWMYLEGKKTCKFEFSSIVFFSIQRIGRSNNRTIPISTPPSPQLIEFSSSSILFLINARNWFTQGAHSMFSIADGSEGNISNSDSPLFSTPWCRDEE